MYDAWLPAFDWSDYQPSPNCAAAVAEGIALGIRKANQGARVGGQARYAVDRDNAERAGLPFGAYCFTEAAQNRNPEAEAGAFLTSTNDLAGCTVAPTLDFEDAVPGAINRVLGPNGSLDFIVRWGRFVKERTGWQAVIYIGLPNPVTPSVELLEHVTWTPNYGSQRDYATMSGIGQRPGWYIPPDQPWTVAEQAMIQPYGDNGRLPTSVMPVGTHVDLDFVNPALLDHITTHGADDMSAADVANINANTDEQFQRLGQRMDNVEQYLGFSGDPAKQGLKIAIREAGWSSRDYLFQLAELGADNVPTGVILPDVFQLVQVASGQFLPNGEQQATWGRVHIATMREGGDSPLFLNVLKKVKFNPYVVPISEPAEVLEMLAIPIVSVAA